MNLIRYLGRESWLLLASATVCALLGGLAGASLVAIIGKGVQASGPPQALAGPFFGLCLAYVAAQTISEIALLHLTQNGILRLRIELSRKLLATPTKKLQELGKHGLQAVLTKDIDVFVQSFLLVPLVFSNAILVAACLGYLAWVSWPLFLVLATCLVLGVAAFQRAERRPLQMMRSVREQVDVLYRNARNLIDGARELRLNAQRGQAYVDGVVAVDARRYRQAFVRGTAGYTCVVNIGSILFYLVIGAMLFVVPAWWPQPAAIMTTVTLVLLYLIRPVSDLVMALPSLRQAGIALQKIQLLESTLHDPQALPAGPGPFEQPGPLRLELQGITHHHADDADDTPFTLGPLDLKLAGGEIVFIIGGNGSGKTTLAMLMLGLYEPEAGTIRLNGVAVGAANTAHYRQHFSAVFADFHLFEQLLATGPDLARRTEHYLQVLGMGQKVKVTDGRFSTVNLSTGQRKRLALVSSYLEDRPIHVFDEWAADQDPAFKRVFYTELLPELRARGKAVVVITHDDAYFDHADRIVKLEDGRLKPVQPRHRPVAEACP